MTFIPLPRGMSDGFYKFMGAGARRTPSGEALMFIRETIMIRVPQRTSRDCAVAALATLSGHSYESIREWFHLIDFDTNGAHLPGVEQWLSDHGYWYRKVSKYPGVMCAPPRSDWPCDPFSERHIILVRVAKDSPCDHWVCMDGNGIVIDPLFDGPRKLGDYFDVLNVIGLKP